MLLTAKLKSPLMYFCTVLEKQQENQFGDQRGLDRYSCLIQAFEFVYHLNIYCLDLDSAVLTTVDFQLLELNVIRLF